MKLKAIGLAVAVLWGIAARGQGPPPPMGPPGMMPALGPYGGPPAGFAAPPGSFPMPPGNFAMPHAMPHAMSPFAMPPPGYPGMPGPMPFPGPYPGGPGDGGCCEPCAEDSCSPGFGRFGGCGDGFLGHCGLLGGGGGGGGGGGSPDGGPCWRLRLEALLLNFSVPREPAVLSTLDDEPVLGIRDLEMDHELNVRLTLERRLFEDHSLEFTYWGLFHARDSAVATGPNLQSPYLLLNGLITDAAPYDFALEHDIAYSSDLNNFEVNYWSPAINHSHFQCALMAGIRFLHIAEEFDYNAIDSALFGPPQLFGTTHIDTYNFAIGPQVGLMGWVPLNERVSARVDMKTGALYNFAGQETDIDVFEVDTGLQLLDYSEEADTSKGAFFLELSGVLITQINCHVGVYVGYQAFWINEFVFAPEQFNPVFPTAASGRPVTINDRGNRLYHGPLAGLELTW